MSRLVESVPKGASLFAAGDDGGGDGLPQRVAKYVPAEIIAVYLFLLPIVIAGSDAGSDRREILLGIIFVICLIFTPLYFSKASGKKKARWYHMVISTAALVVWVYAIPGGFFDDVGLYDSVAAAILMAVFTLASGLIAPTADPE